MSVKTHYDYIVVGCGGVGSATIYWLAKNGGDVLGIEQYNLGHDHGGSQDHSRIIRLSYSDDFYTALAKGAYTAWQELERESGVQVLYKTGSVNLAYKGSLGESLLNIYARSMDRQNVPYEKWSGEVLRQNYPQWTVGSDIASIYQADGGLVDAAQGNSTHVQMARKHGATILTDLSVTRLSRIAPDHMMVHTTGGVFHCKRVIVCAGAWINSILGSVGVHIPVKVTQEQVTYYGTPHVKEFTKERFPVFMFHEGKYDVYGLPMHGNTGSKIGIDARGKVVTASTRTYQPNAEVEQEQNEFLSKYIPKALGPKMYTKTCLYTMTLDRHFVVDTCASTGHPEVIVCCGAGHAYKFASVLGQILSDLAMKGKTTFDITQFTMDRRAIKDPLFKPNLILGNHNSSKL
ncbi:monomeric sarcosine oxidase-like [Anneissia japonica]|uniref:monomeric sarcosine oxidase-like n=1 Tax=Anneissia japonica TaxID=1529436 RepID=UPI00142588EC|nr:monomeric sarcosine oxidase-like [Anneissia japonica]